eukprot:1160714-Pelagomonas_calceolata.AAC.5
MKCRRGTYVLFNVRRAKPPRRNNAAETSEVPYIELKEVELRYKYVSNARSRKFHLTPLAAPNPVIRVTASPSVLFKRWESRCGQTATHMCEGHPDQGDLLVGNCETFPAQPRTQRTLNGSGTHRNFRFCAFGSSKEWPLGPFYIRAPFASAKLPLQAGSAM